MLTFNLTYLVRPARLSPLVRPRARFDRSCARDRASNASSRIFGGFLWAGLSLTTACSLELPGLGANRDQFDAAVVATNDADGEVSSAEPRPPEAMANQQPSDAGEPLRDGASSPTDAGSPGLQGDAASALDAGCVLDGRFALRLLFHVTWVGTEIASIVPIISEGKGELSIDLLMDVKSQGSGLTANLRTCASHLPEFVATLSRERYQAYFTDAVWDSPSIPTFDTELRTTCRRAGCRVDSPPHTALLGARLPSPMDPWPMDPKAGEWPDDDADGAPGIAVQLTGPERGGRHAYPPLDLFSSRRVHDLMLGLRLIVGLEGTLDSCDKLHGESVQGSIRTRAVGCNALTSPMSCVPRELEFLNENLPVWTVDTGTFEAQRVAPDADCKVVRELLDDADGPKN